MAGLSGWNRDGSPEFSSGRSDSWSHGISPGLIGGFAAGAGVLLGTAGVATPAIGTACCACFCIVASPYACPGAVVTGWGPRVLRSVRLAYAVPGCPSLDPPRPLRGTEPPNRLAVLKDHLYPLNNAIFAKRWMLVGGCDHGINHEIGNPCLTAPTEDCVHHCTLPIPAASGCEWSDPSRSLRFARPAGGCPMVGCPCAAIACCWGLARPGCSSGLALG